MENDQKPIDVSNSKTWQSFYEESKTGWERHETHPALVAWLENKTLQPPCRIVIPGCGRGIEPLELAKRGFQVLAIDFAETAVEFQAQQLNEFGAMASVAEEDIFTYTPSDPFDVVYEQTCLCAIHPVRRSDYEKSIFRCLKPGGLMLALFMQTKGGNDGPPFHCDIADMKTLFPASRWQWKIDAQIGQGSPVRYDHPIGEIFEIAYALERKDINHAC
jgi:SAM-dependent methyltransferase